MSELWQRLRAIRKYADLRQSDVATACGISRAAVAQWEASEAEKRTKPGIKEIQILAKLSGVPVEWILNDAAKTEEVWEVAKLAKKVSPPVTAQPEPAPLLADHERRFAAAFVQAIQFSLMQQRPDMAEGFNRKIGEGNHAVTTDYAHGNLLVEIVAKPGDLVTPCGNLLMAERALGGSLRKVVLVLGGVADSFLDIEIVPVSTPQEAADFLIKAS